MLEGLPLQAPFRGAIQIEDYQLEPVVRALRMPRVNLLIADDVGLGKTIEAGMVVQELLARQRIRRILVVCPASLQRQWHEEMLQKFALRFEIVDRAYIQRLRREYGVHVNPWASYPRLITSMDFLKREAPLGSFMASLKQDRGGGLRDWDLLVIDEAHNVAPSGRKAHVRGRRVTSTPSTAEVLTFVSSAKASAFARRCPRWADGASRSTTLVSGSSPTRSTSVLSSSS